MGRRNQGPRLRYLKKRATYYITWTERGRSRERSTGTRDRAEAELVFAEWLQVRGRRNGPSDPAQTLVTDVLADYAMARAPKVMAPQVMCRAIEMLTGFWEGKLVAEVRPEMCSLYCEKRARSNGTVRREIGGVLQAAINWAHKKREAELCGCANSKNVLEPRDRWLTRQEGRSANSSHSRAEKARLYMPLLTLLGLYTGRRKEAILFVAMAASGLENEWKIGFGVSKTKRKKKRRGIG